MPRLGSGWKMVVEFPTPEALLEFYDELQRCPHLPERADLFAADALDMGRADPRTFIARNKHERPSTTSLRELVARREQAAQEGGEKAREKVKKVLR